MKDNPVQRLDLLEAQLNRLESKDENLSAGKLGKTKYLLERLEKNGSLSSNPKQLRSEIAEVKREIVQRKLYYAINTVKRFLKQFKKVEPLRIAKRTKNAEDPSKKSMLDSELELVKNSSIEDWSSEIVNRGFVKHFDMKAATGSDFDKRALSPPEINVFARIGKTEAVRNAIVQLVESVSMYVEPSSPIESQTKAASKPATAAEKTSTKTTDDNKKIEKPKEDDFTQFAPEKEPKEEKPVSDPFFEQPVSATTNYDDISDSEQEDDGFDMNNGLPIFHQGYISGSDEEDEPEPEAQPVRRNRRGQRARRKIWEQKFGTRANHVMKEQREEQKKQEEKESKKRRRAEKEMAAKRQKTEFAAKPVHPSWEAHQRQKEKNEQAKFAGKRMKFD